MMLKRLVPSLLVTALTLAVTTAPAKAQNAGSGLVITDIELTDFEIIDNVLMAAGTVEGTLAGLPFTADITNFALQLIPDDPDTAPVECSVLDLELAPISLALLGLHVDTSAICLEITATEGGGLLGDLLCGLAGGGLLGTGIPVIPTGDALAVLEEGLVDVLNGTAGQDPTPAQHGADSVCSGQCEVLELAVGPLDLSLLGLNVLLDDCEGGPVQVCVSATRSEGILGALLCGLANADLVNLTLDDIATVGRRATELAAGGLTRREIGELTSLLGRLIR